MQIRRMWDLTWPLDERTLVYPGDPAPRLERTHAIDNGDPLTMSVLHTGVHVGTHVDAPLHFLAGSSNPASVDSIPLERLVGPVTVVDVSDAGLSLSRAVLETRSLPRHRHLLFQTASGLSIQEGLTGSRFPRETSFLEPQAADFLTSLSPTSIGWDFYSIDPLDSVDFPAHRRLAAAGIPFTACLNLNGITPGDYFYIVLPLRLTDCEAAPARAILLDLGNGADGIST